MKRMRWRVALTNSIGRRVRVRRRREPDDRRRRGAPLAALTTLPALAIVPLLAAPPVGGLSLESARAGSCAYAHSHPRDITVGQARKAIVCLMNNRRAARGKGKLSSQSGLRKAAGRHSRRMKRSGCFAHRCRGEKDLAGRVSDTSYLPCGCSWGVGENIAWGKQQRATPANIVEAWMNSPGHRQVLLDGAYEHVGVGLTWGTPSRARAEGGVFTADFGYKRG